MGSAQSSAIKTWKKGIFNFESQDSESRQYRMDKRSSSDFLTASIRAGAFIEDSFEKHHMWGVKMISRRACLKRVFYGNGIQWLVHARNL
jgi:hypothetical protein